MLYSVFDFLQSVRLQYPAWLTPQLLYYWGILQIALMIAAVIILISSSEDLIIDVLYWLRWLAWPFLAFKRPRSKTVRAKPERLTAVLVPAWHETNVIAKMLEGAVATLEYEAYHIFVGVYPNDPETEAEVAKAAAQYPRVHAVVVARPGPTTKADCLNQLVRGAMRYEALHGLHFEIFVNHDAEDVIHPFELKLMNWYVGDAGMVQLPVLSLERDWKALTACHYMDEFAEWHTKDLVVRSMLTGMTPSAGVGTGFSRAAFDAVMAARNGNAYDVDSLTEDYEVAFFLHDLGFRSKFVRYRAKMPYYRKALFREGNVLSYRHELVATREYFPDRVSTSSRQKSRWIIGIALDGWRRLGWRGDFVHKFFLWRDRKVLFSAPAVIIGYLLVIQALSFYIAEWFVRDFPSLPSLVDRPWVWTVIYINLILMLNRMFHRALFVGLAHGSRYVLLSPLRIVVGNWITFRAFLRAVRKYTYSRFAGRAVAWDKTAHTFPVLVRLKLAGAADSADSRAIAVWQIEPEKAYP